MKSEQNLTPRERQVIESLCEGNSNKMIARQLCITEGTVKVHLNNIFAKLGVTNRTALAVIFMNKELGSAQAGICNGALVGTFPPLQLATHTA